MKTNERSFKLAKPCKVGYRGGSLPMLIAENSLGFTAQVEIQECDLDVDQARALRDWLTSVLPDEPTRDPTDVIKAAIDWAYCPKWGSYRGGPAMEDTSEVLNMAVREYTGKDIEEPSGEPWSLDEMRAAVNRPAESK